MKLTVMTWNTLFAGHDGEDASRAHAQIGVVNEIRPDVFLMQEAKGFETGGFARLYDLEQRLGMRGFLSQAPSTGQHVAVFIRPPLRPLSFESDSSNFHHATASLRVALPNALEATFISAHLCSNGAWVRKKEAAYLAVRATPDRFVLLGGDFNSASPHDAEPGDFAELPAVHRTRYLADDGRLADRTVLASLENAGWVDIGHSLGGTDVPTVPAAGFSNTEFATMRCDYLMATGPMAASAKTYDVIRKPATDNASDHYPVVATFELTT